MDDPEAAERVRSELADVVTYLVRLTDVPGVDLIETTHAKIDQNEKRFPVRTTRGQAGRASSDTI